MHYLKPDPSPKQMSSCVNLVDFQSLASWIETTVSSLSYELGVNGTKKLIKTCILLIKMDITFHTGKNESYESVPKKLLWFILTSFR